MHGHLVLPAKAVSRTHGMHTQHTLQRSPPLPTAPPASSHPATGALCPPHPSPPQPTLPHPNPTQPPRPALHRTPTHLRTLAVTPHPARRPRLSPALRPLAPWPPRRLTALSRRRRLAPCHPQLAGVVSFAALGLAPGGAEKLTPAVVFSSLVLFQVPAWRASLQGGEGEVPGWLLLGGAGRVCVCVTGGRAGARGRRGQCLLQGDAQLVANDALAPSCARPRPPRSGGQQEQPASVGGVGLGWVGLPRRGSCCGGSVRDALLRLLPGRPPTAQTGVPPVPGAPPPPVPSRSCASRC